MTRVYTPFRLPNFLPDLCSKKVSWSGKQSRLTCSKISGHHTQFGGTLTRQSAGHPASRSECGVPGIAQSHRPSLGACGSRVHGFDQRAQFAPGATCSISERNCSRRVGLRKASNPVSAKMAWRIGGGSHDCVRCALESGINQKLLRLQE